MHADMAGQTRSVLAQLDELLAAHGSGRDHLLSALIFVTDMKAKAEMNKVWKAWLSPAQLPTRATIGGSDLDGYAIEAGFTAPKAGGGPPAAGAARGRTAGGRDGKE